MPTLMKTLFLAVSLGLAGFAAAGQRPDVILITVDDLNDWTGCMGGHPHVKTPNIDRLAARGILYTNAHCQATVCNPSQPTSSTSLTPVGLPSTEEIDELKAKHDPRVVCAGQGSVVPLRGNQMASHHIRRPIPGPQRDRLHDLTMLGDDS